MVADKKNVGTPHGGRKRIVGKLHGGRQINRREALWWQNKS